MPDPRPLEVQDRYFLPVMLLATLLLPATIGSSPSIFNDGDVSWHIATGDWILNHGAIPRTDPFSFTWTGRPWVPIEWLAEVTMACAYLVRGYSGIAALVTAALMAMHAIVFFNAVRHVRPLVALGILFALDVVLLPTSLARPHLLAWPLLALWTWLMLRAREQGTSPPIASALLLTLWANFHGSFMLGLVIAGAFGLEAVIAAKDRTRTIRDWGIFGLASAIAVSLNANGIDGVLHPLHIADLAMLPLIQEWSPSSPSFTPWFFVILTSTLALMWFKAVRLPLTRWLLLAVLLGLAMLQMRQQAVLAIVAAMLLPHGFARRESTATASYLMKPVLAAAVTALVVRLIIPISPPQNGANPWKLIAAVPPELRSQPVLNAYSMGGPLIMSGIRPYIDGRGDMYGDEFVNGYAKIQNGDREEFDAAVSRWNIRWAILPNGATRLIALLDRTPGWRLIHKDEVGVIYVRA